MPSLRRSFSSPSVRSSPYRSSLSSSLIFSPARPHPRRSSGSATAERRVLADIEWWRVHDGQCDQLQPHYDDATPSGTVTLSAGASLEPPLTDSFQSTLAVLSIAPSSPPGRDASVESTPEPPTFPLETIQLGLAGPADCPSTDHFPFPFPPLLARHAGRQVHPLFGSRSVSAPVSSHHGAFVPDFADMGGDAFSLDQNLFQ